MSPKIVDLQTTYLACARIAQEVHRTQPIRVVSRQTQKMYAIMSIYPLHLPWARLRRRPLQAQAPLPPLQQEEVVV